QAARKAALLCRRAVTQPPERKPALQRSEGAKKQAEPAQICATMAAFYNLQKTFFLSLRVQGAIWADVQTLESQTSRTDAKNIGTERETPARRRTVQERIRSGKKNAGCRAQEGNVVEPPKRRTSPRKIGESKAKAKRPQQTSPVHATKCEPRV